MDDKELFLKLLAEKEKYKVCIDNDAVWFNDKEELKKYEEDDDFKMTDYSFNEYGYYLLNEIFQALGIDSDFV